MRSSPSEADRLLMQRLHEQGLSVSASQLERWRQRGLLPRALVERPQFGGCRVEQHPEEVLQATTILAELSRRGRPWQLTAAHFFSHGLWMSSAAVRSAAALVHDASLSEFRRAWAEVEAGADPVGDDPDGWLADLADRAASRVDRGTRRAVRRKVQFVHPELSQTELREAAQAALAWEIADVNLPEYLTEQQRNWARHGVDEPLNPYLELILPLASERAACIKTLTWPEARIAFDHLLAEGDELPGTLRPLLAATWRVTEWRLVADRGHPERPLSQTQMDGLIELLADADPERPAEVEGDAPLGTRATSDTATPAGGLALDQAPAPTVNNIPGRYS